MIKKMIYSALLGSMLALAGCGASLPVKMNANSTFSNPAEQVGVNGISSLTESKKILVPSNWVQTMVSGEQKSYKDGAHAKANVHIGGMTSQLGEEIATELYDDLVTKLRNDGWEVFTFEDIKNNSDVVDIDRMEVDKDYGFTGIEKDYTGQGDKVWMFSSPASAPTFDLDFTGIQPPTSDLHSIARSLGAHMVWPRYMFVTPIMYSETASGYKKNYASVGLVPAVELNHSFSSINFNSLKGGWGAIKPNEVKRIADNVGEIEELSASQSQDVALFSFNVFRSMSKGDYKMILNQSAFKDATVKAGKDLNSLAVDAFNAALKAE